MADPTTPASDAAAAAGAADMDGSAAAAADDAFVRHASLAYAVPLATDDRLEQALQQCARTGGAPRPLIEGLPQRASLFFDETADVYLIVRTPFLPAGRLAAYGARLALSLEAHILNSAAVPGRGAGGAAAGPAPVVEAIYSGRVDAGTAPLVAVSDPAAGESDSDNDSDNDSESASESARSSGSESPSEDTSESGRHAAGHARRRKRAPPRHSYLVWKLPVFLRRPRARLHGPAVSFSATATLLPAAAAASLPATPASADPAGYLRSREPSGLNLLAAFTGDPALAPARGDTGQHTDGDGDGGVVWPRLSAQRVARVAPAGTGGAGGGDGYPLNNDGDDETGRRHRQPRPLRVLQKTLAFQIAPAVHTRVRFARANHGATAAPTDPAVVALLEVDFTPFFDCEAVLTHIALTLPGGSVTDLNTVGDAGGRGLGLPVYCVARDHLTFLYRLAPHEHGRSPTTPAASPSTTRDVAIALEARVLVRPGVCAPRLRLAWTAALDFAPPVNPAFGAALLPPAPLQRAHRPSQLSIDGMSSFAAPAVSRPDALPSLDGLTNNNNGLSVETTLPNFGITVTLTAPARPVYAGEPFRWAVLVVNRAGGADVPSAASASLASAAAPAASSAAPGRRLALLVLPKRRRNDVRVLRPPSASATTSAPTPPVADAVLDDNIVHAMQSSSLVDRTAVVCLSSADDTRIGPLAPGACHAAALRFVALRAGVVAVDAVRVVDLGSQEHVDVRALPAMVIAEGRRP